MSISRETVIADLVEMLYATPEELQDDADLTELGLDSLRLATLVQRWQEAGSNVQFAELAERPILGVWLDVLS